MVIGMYINVIGDRRNGKTTALVKLAVNNVISDSGSFTVFITGDTQAGAHVMSAIRLELLALGADIERATRDEITLENKSRIKVIAVGSNGRGFSPDYAIIDNIDKMNEDILFSLRMMLYNTKFIYASSEKQFKL